MLFNMYDGTGRPPRQQQKEVLDWLSSNWTSSDAFAILAPTATGKSFIAKSIQLATGGHILTCDNSLVRQYISDYSDSNWCIGGDHYATKKEKLHYYSRSFEGYPSIFNPASYYHLKDKIPTPTCLILDEADQQLGLIRLQLGRTIKMPLETKVNSVTVREAIKNCDNPGLKADFLRNQHNYSFEESYIKDGERVVTVYKIGLDRSTILRMFPEDIKLVFLSGTLFSQDMRELSGGRDIKYYESSSPIPAGRRPILLDPLYEPDGGKSPLDYPVEYDKVAEHLKMVLDRYKDFRPAVIHCTYEDSLRLKELIPDLLRNNKDDKAEVLLKIKENKSEVLGAGMTTGLDLKDDKCRLNIILKARFPSLGNLFVSKRVSQSRFGNWYIEETLRQCIQAAGRSTRSANDYSITTIIDHRLIATIRNNGHLLPNYFKEAYISDYDEKVKTVDKLRELVEGGDDV